MPKEVSVPLMGILSERWKGYLISVADKAENASTNN
jgi:hypothetical protein